MLCWFWVRKLEITSTSIPSYTFLWRNQPSYTFLWRNPPSYTFLWRFSRLIYFCDVISRFIDFLWRNQPSYRFLWRNHNFEVYRAISLNKIRMGIRMNKKYCMNIHLNIDLFTFNTYCACKLLYMTITHYQNKTLFNKNCFSVQFLRIC